MRVDGRIWNLTIVVEVVAAAAIGIMRHAEVRIDVKRVVILASSRRVLSHSR